MEKLSIAILAVSVMLLGVGCQPVQESAEPVDWTGAMTVLLPEYLSVGQSDEEVCWFTSSDKAVCSDLDALAEPLPQPSDWRRPGGMTKWQGGSSVSWQEGQMKAIELPWNHAEQVEPGESITDAAMPAYLILVEHDLYTAASLEQAEQRYGEITPERQTVSIWHVFFAQPDSDWVYELWLNARMLSKEQVLEIMHSAVFDETAFVQD